MFVCLPPSVSSHLSPLEHKLLENWNPVTLFTIVVLTVLHLSSAQSIFVEEMKEAGGGPPLVLISAGNLSFYYHLVGTFVYCGVGEKYSTYLSLTQAEGRSQRGQRAPPCGVPVICVLVEGTERAPCRRGFLEEATFELNSEGSKMWDGGNKRGRKGIPGGMNSVSKGQEARKHGHMPKGESNSS